MGSDVPTDRDHPVRATRRIVRNAAYLAVADGSSKLMVFAYSVIAARHLGAAQLGILSTALALVTMFAVLTDLGLGAVAAREIARDPARAIRQVGSALAMKLLASILAILLIVVSARLIGYGPQQLIVVYICSVFVLESATATYYCYVFQGFERMELAALTRMVQTVVLIVGAVVLSRFAPVVEHYALLYVGAGLLAALFAVVTASTLSVRPTLSFSIVEWRALLRQAAPLGVAVALTMFYYWNGTTLLSKFAGSEAVGNYTAAFRLVMGMSFVGFSVSGAVYPIMSRLSVSDPARSTRGLESTARYMIVFVIPIAVLLAAFAHAFVRLVYGGDYTSAVPVLRVLAPWGVLACLNSLLSNYFISGNRPSIVTVQTGAALGINLVLNLLLISRHGALGAAVALVAAELLGTAFLLLVLRRSATRPNLGPVLLTLAQVGGALFVAALALLILPRSPLAAKLAVAFAVYMLGLSVHGGLRREALHLFRSLLATERG